MNNRSTIETHPWESYIPAKAHALVIGTFPTAGHNRSFEFFYPNLRNAFWQILAELAETTIPGTTEPVHAILHRKNILDILRVGITDMGLQVRRNDNASIDEKLELLEYMDIIGLLTKHPTIRTVVLTSTSGKVCAASWFVDYLRKKEIACRIRKGPKPLSVQIELANRPITIACLYSPSPRAAHRISFAQLCDMYRSFLVVEA